MKQVTTNVCTCVWRAATVKKYIFFKIINDNFQSNSNKVSHYEKQYIKILCLIFTHFWITSFTIIMFCYDNLISSLWKACKLSFSHPHSLYCLVINRTFHVFFSMWQLFLTCPLASSKSKDSLHGKRTSGLWFVSEPVTIIKDLKSEGSVLRLKLAYNVSLHEQHSKQLVITSSL